MLDKDEENRRLREQDLYAWSKATELLLVDRRIQEIDWDAVGDELEKSAGMNDANPVREAVEKLLTHLTIWNAGSQYHSPARRSEIESARFKIDDTLSRSPSLAGLIELEWRSLYRRARFAAMLILGEKAALHEVLTSDLVLVTADEPEAETEALALMRLSLRITGLKLRVATNPDDETDDSDEDHYAWCRAQAAAARSRQFDELDPIGIAEEISSVGTSVRRAVIESLAGLLDKVIAWQARRCSLSLKIRIASDRARVRALLFKNPSLAAAPELMTEAHKFIVREGEWGVVARESMSLQSSRWTLAEVVDDASITERDSAFADARDAS
ncbi:MAG: DUF29 family protein [Candidatus Binatus sp.]|uniref:DUF29 family protein n=1 Tax=Candidatus Binatus sp. TaxID=2811406 RepID=UPI003BAE833B